MRNRSGKIGLGCLLGLALAGAVAYTALDAIPTYIRYYQMRDEMKVQARFAVNLSDDLIRRRLTERADQLKLPAEAKRFSVRRRSRPREITIGTTWRDTLNLPFYQLPITFRPEVRAGL